jgi:hypothetical protein
MDDLEKVEKHWWWRHLEFADYRLPDDKDCEQAKWYETVPRKGVLANPCYSLTLEFQEWKKRTELPAWWYELLRRQFGPDSLKPFPWIDAHLHSLLLGGFGERSEPVAQIVLSGKVNSDTFSEPIPPFQFDLSASNSALVEQFLLWIAEQRSKKGLPNNLISKDPKGNLKTYSFPSGSTSKEAKPVENHKRKRSVVWRTIELLDITKTRELSYPEIKIVERARREARKMESKFTRMLSNWRSFCENSPLPPESDSNFPRFLRKHFPQE